MSAPLAEPGTATRRVRIPSAATSGSASGDVDRIVRDLTAPRPFRWAGFCIYCGTPCRGLTCRGHRDLLALDVNTAKGVSAHVNRPRAGAYPDRTGQPSEGAHHDTDQSG